MTRNLMWTISDLFSFLARHTLPCVKQRVEVMPMATNLQIDDSLINKAVELQPSVKTLYFDDLSRKLNAPG